MPTVTEAVSQLTAQLARPKELVRKSLPELRQRVIRRVPNLILAP